MIDVGETLGRKIGPLPVWAWGGVVGGGLLIARAVSGNDGASSPFVQPIAQDGAFDFEGGGGGAGGGGGDQSPPWYATIPGVGTIIDRPPGEVTIIKPPTTGTPSTPGTSTPTPRTFLTLTKRTFLFRNPLKPHTGEGASGSYVVQKVRIGGKWWYKIVGTKSGAASSRIGQYIPFYSNPTTYRVATGDTMPFPMDGRGDSTPGTPIIAAGVLPPTPLGRMPRYTTDMGFPGGEPFRIYTGPSLDQDTPIPSSARVVMPSFNGDNRTGSVAIPKVPYPSARAGRFDPRRGLDPVARAFDRLRPPVPPTTVRVSVDPLARFREALAARRSITG